MNIKNLQRFKRDIEFLGGNIHWGLLDSKKKIGTQEIRKSGDYSEEVLQHACSVVTLCLDIWYQRWNTGLEEISTRFSTCIFSSLCFLFNTTAQEVSLFSWNGRKLEHLFVCLLNTFEVQFLSAIIQIHTEIIKYVEARKQIKPLNALLKTIKKLLAQWLLN